MPTSIDGNSLNALADAPDFRDRYYEPSLIELLPEITPPPELSILNQGTEGACTGFGLAAVINKLNQDRGSKVRVSSRMLYEMAKKFDQWPGEQYSGSSCRGAIKGWYSMGVCSEGLWKYRPRSRDLHLTVKRAKDARSNTLGAYYRIRKNIVDMHAALNEVGAVYCSANVHKGWSKAATRSGVIKQHKDSIGGHAFAIVGYTSDGFLVQNSWGKSWGDNGIALWKYEDWHDNVNDAWVVRLTLPTPQLWGREPANRSDTGTAEFFWSSPRRDEIAGHFVHIDDGRFHDEGRYWSTLQDVKETAKFTARRPEYDHLLVYAHGGLNSPKASATRIAAMKNTFKQNGVYPFHFMYDTGLMEEIKDLVLGKKSNAEALAGGFSDWWDRRVEGITRRPGRALWREMKSDAAASFRSNSRPGRQTMRAFLSAMQSPDAHQKKIHLVGHSTGAILLAHMLQALDKMGVETRISTVSLLAPAATIDLYKTHFKPLLKTGGFGIDNLVIYNLSEKLEQDDNVAQVYRKSLLYLVSNAFEEKREVPLLGMQKFSNLVPTSSRLKIVYSQGVGSRETASESHGGFDNDPVTMNHILKRVLGGNPSAPFTAENLSF